MVSTAGPGFKPTTSWTWVFTITTRPRRLALKLKTKALSFEPQGQGGGAEVLGELTEGTLSFIKTFLTKWSTCKKGYLQNNFNKLIFCYFLTKQNLTFWPPPSWLALTQLKIEIFLSKQNVQECKFKRSNIKIIIFKKRNVTFYPKLITFQIQDAQNYVFASINPVEFFPFIKFLL